jgi:hypothetical protein
MDKRGKETLLMSENRWARERKGTAWESLSWFSMKKWQKRQSLRESENSKKMQGCEIVCYPAISGVESDRAGKRSTNFTLKRGVNQNISSEN